MEKDDYIFMLFISFILIVFAMALYQQMSIKQACIMTLRSNNIYFPYP